MSAHTPECQACTIEYGHDHDHDDYINYCPIHAAAPRMLEFIREYAWLSLGTDIISKAARDILRDVEGESNG